MSTTTIAVILIGLFILLLIYWLVRSRGNTTGHIDTTLTGVGAATEAVEDLIDAVKHRADTPPVPEPEPEPAPAAAAEPVEPSPKAVKPAAAKAAKPAAAKTAKPAAPKAAKPAAAKETKPAAAKEAPAAKAAPAVEKAPSKPAASKPAKTEPDNLRQIKGVGPKLVTLLAELGVTRFDQIAAWKAADIEKIDEQLGTFKGRPTRDNWVEQAALLAKGDIAGFEAKFGKLDG